jgi:hypothetical protein
MLPELPGLSRTDSSQHAFDELLLVLHAGRLEKMAPIEESDELDTGDIVILFVAWSVGVVVRWESEVVCAARSLIVTVAGWLPPVPVTSLTVLNSVCIGEAVETCVLHEFASWVTGEETVTTARATDRAATAARSPPELSLFIPATLSVSYTTLITEGWTSARWSTKHDTSKFVFRGSMSACWSVSHLSNSFSLHVF